MPNETVLLWIVALGENSTKAANLAKRSFPEAADCVEYCDAARLTNEAEIKEVGTKVCMDVRDRVAVSSTESLNACGEEGSGRDFGCGETGLDEAGIRHGICSTVSAVDFGKL